MGEVGEAELFGDGMSDVYVWRLTGLEMVVHGSDNGIEDTVVSRNGDRLVGGSWIWKGLRDDLDGFAS